MNNPLDRGRISLAGVLICGVALVGCGVKSAPTTAQSAAPVAPHQNQAVEQQMQERSRVLQSIKTMTPEQRAAYFKAHPQDVRALAQ